MTSRRNGYKTFELSWRKEEGCSPTPQCCQLKGSAISFDVITTACNHNVWSRRRTRNCQFMSQELKTTGIAINGCQRRLQSPNLVPGSHSCLLFTASVYLTSNVFVPLCSFGDSEFNTTSQSSLPHHIIAAASSKTFSDWPFAASETTPLAAVKSAVSIILYFVRGACFVRTVRDRDVIYIWRLPFPAK